MRPANNLAILITAQLIITLALLAFAVDQSDAGLKYVVVGAVIGHWLNETPRLGAQVAQAIQSAKET